MAKGSPSGRVRPGERRGRRHRRRAIRLGRDDFRACRCLSLSTGTRTCRAPSGRPLPSPSVIASPETTLDGHGVYPVLGKDRCGRTSGSIDQRDPDTINRFAGFAVEHHAERGSTKHLQFRLRPVTVSVPGTICRKRDLRTVARAQHAITGHQRRGDAAGIDPTGKDAAVGCCFEYRQCLAIAIGGWQAPRSGLSIAAGSRLAACASISKNNGSPPRSCVCRNNIGRRDAGGFVYRGECLVPQGCWSAAPDRGCAPQLGGR